MVNAVPFHEKEYWKKRFEKENHFEWLMTWKDIQPSLEPYFHGNENKPILHLGCGNSKLAFEMADSGYTKIINVDYAENVIDYMKSITDNQVYPDIEWHVGHCTSNLASYLPNQHYDILLDKSLIDAIACGDDHKQTQVKTAAREFLSVAQLNALWFSISFSGEREFYCDNQEKTYWKTLDKLPVQIHQPNDKPGAPPIYYYIYINQKVSNIQ